MNEAEIKEFQAKVYKWQRDPESFAREALCVPFISNQQVRAFGELQKLVRARIRRMEGKQLRAEDRKYLKKIGLSIMAGRGVGKDCFVSWVIAWFVFCFEDSKVGCTAPTKRQLRGVLWAEIHKWLKNSLIAEAIDWQAERICMKTTDKKGKDTTGQSWYAEARTCKMSGSPEEQAETLSGLHANFMMFVMDEGSILPYPVFTTCEQSMTGPCNLMIVIFNPTRSKGYAIDTQYKNRKVWACDRWNAEESDLNEHLPGLTDAINSCAEQYGKESVAYRISVLGLPPTADDSTLIPMDWIMDCVRLEDQDHRPPMDDDPLVYGVDIGGGGNDPSVIMRRRGHWVYDDISTYSTNDSEMLIGWIMKEVLADQPDITTMDSIGVGWAVSGALQRRLPSAYKVFGVNVSTGTSDVERFERLKDELAWSLREKFEKRSISIPNNAELIAELSCVRVVPDKENGKLQVLPKKKMKDLGIDSPNKFEALMLMEYYGDETMRKMTQKDSRKKSRRKGPTWKTA